MSSVFYNSNNVIYEYRGIFIILAIIIISKKILLFLFDSIFIFKIKKAI